VKRLRRLLERVSVPYVELHAHNNVQSFLEAAGPVLLRDEARHNLMFGICSTLAETPDAYPVSHLWTVVAEGETVLAALMTPPFNLLVGRPADPVALGFAAEALLDQRLSVPGVTGALPEVDGFADAWERLSGTFGRLRMAQGVYAVRAVRFPEAVEGRMRLSTTDDRELLVGWFDAFVAESLPEDWPHQDAGEAVDRRLRSSGGFALWEDGEVVSLSGFGGETPHGIRIGPVYTPPHFRRRGYASALVAQLSQQLLDGGRDYCFLYTDLANPTSNRIYMDVGYELVCESADYVFRSRATK
jgi:predicted GNAT family acetyltransferase